ncbi:SUMF1/EgtB/PvdO family nonheme iron enzyme [bacterium]|nr:SUMF1/EgtB/PvdO family nonheme iron enzyme [bacterium]
MTPTPDLRHIRSIQAVNVAERQTIIADGQHIEIPPIIDVIAYLAGVRDAYSHWADDSPQDRFLPTRALPMRLAEYRPDPGQGEAPSVDLLKAVQDAQRTFILGEPGAGKTAALERLAWVIATESLAQAQDDPAAPLRVPILARLADYSAEADLIPLLRRALNKFGPWNLGDGSVRLLLWADNLRFVLLLDGLNEFAQGNVDAGRRSLRNHLSDYGDHTVHISCRTADFDAVQEANPERQVLPNARLWTVQPLLDGIRHWGDDGESDVRDYLRFHLAEADARRLYEHIRGDERLTEIARIPLFLYMFRVAAEGADGQPPKDRGELLQGFVTSPRVLGRIPDRHLRELAEECFECLGWQMQQDGRLDTNRATLQAALERAKGKSSVDVDTMRDHLQEAGLLIDLGRRRYKLLHQLIQEYAAAAYLLNTGQTAAQIPELARDEFWRETCIAALWLDKALHTADYLLSIMRDPHIDLRVRVVAAEILGEVGDPRFVRKYYSAVEAIEPPMIAIPAGLATLGGDDPEAYDDEKPGCQVQVNAFDLAVYPVTNAEFRCFVEAGGYEDESLWTEGGRSWLRGEGKLDDETEQDLRSFYQEFSHDVESWIARTRQRQAMDDALADNYRWFAANWSEDQYINAYANQILGEQRREPYYWGDSRFNQPNQPVVGVNWYEAMAYAAWMARITGKAYRLPTEAEWEWAARRNQRRYPWPGDWDGDRCNWRGSRLNRPNPVGVYPHGATPDGLHEMAGNVFDWTLSLYRRYEYHPEDGREDPNADGLRVLRGGSWYTDRDTVRCAYRHRNYAWRWYLNHGFRLARTSL